MNKREKTRFALCIMFYMIPFLIYLVTVFIPFALLHVVCEFFMGRYSTHYLEFHEYDTRAYNIFEKFGEWIHKMVRKII